MSAEKRFSKVSADWPGPKSKALVEKWHRYEADVVGFQAPIVWDTAQGCMVTDVDGNRYIDWTSGVLVTNVGHCHPTLVKAVQQASARLLNNYECPNVERIQAAEDLCKALPPHLDKCFFLSTGSEAIEGILRLMKRKTGKYEIIGFHNGFHGRTTNAATLGGMMPNKKGYGPGVPGIIRLPYPNPYRDPLGFCSDGPEFKRYFNYMEEVIYSTSTDSLAGVIVEPYQGAGGFIFPPKGWLKQLETWTRSKGLLFAVDEVQAAYGRTGAMWAHEHEGLKPDMMAVAKAIGCGISVSAVAATSDVFSCLKKGEMSSTYGGNPVASAAVSAVLKIYREEGLVERSKELGGVLKTGLKAIQSKVPAVGDVRGMGLVMGVELVKDKESKIPAPELIRPLITEASRRGLLIGAVGSLGNVIRVAPPLCISVEEIEESLAIFEEALLAVTDA